MSQREYADLPARQRRRLLLRAFVRPTLSAVALFLLYYLLPFDGRLSGRVVLSLAGGLVVVAGLLVWQVQKIRTASYPLLRAIEALAVTLPLFIIIFATSYFVTSANVPGAFSEDLTRTDSLYFTVTVLSTVGFGDITPVLQGTRALVMVQMIGDLFLVGIVAKVIVGAVQTGLQSRDDQQGTGPD
ncbi:MAG: potassium channel family protein [Dermatophilaceae bacterium]